MAKLADALASGASDRKVMGVQVPLRAQKNLLIVQGFFILDHLTSLSSSFILMGMWDYFGTILGYVLQICQSHVV